VWTTRPNGTVHVSDAAAREKKSWRRRQKCREALPARAPNTARATETTQHTHTRAGQPYLKLIVGEDKRVQLLQAAEARQLPQPVAGEDQGGERPRRRGAQRKVGRRDGVAGRVEHHQAGEADQRFQRSEAVARLPVATRQRAGGPPGSKDKQGPRRLTTRTMTTRRPRKGQVERQGASKALKKTRHRHDPRTTSTCVRLTHPVSPDMSVSALCDTLTTDSVDSADRSSMWV